ncbi:MAG: sugar MFS transporter [Bacteroidales bacterium]
MSNVSVSTGKNNYTIAFVWLIVVFFMWGFITVLNDLLIPHFKTIFGLNYSLATLVQLVFFGAYFVGSLIYFFISRFYGDPILKIGYKNGLITGLVVSAIGAALFFPAAQLISYSAFLIAIFVIGLGFSLLQISGNPYVAVLGPEKSSSSRLNLAQGFNSLGTTLGPIIGGWAFYDALNNSEKHIDIGPLKISYVVFALVFLLLAVMLFFAHMPKMSSSNSVDQKGRAFDFPQLRFGMLGIFFYVGAEVSIGSLMINYLEQPSIAGITQENGPHYLAMFWGGQMIGRFIGAVSLSSMKNKILKYGLMVLFPVIGFVIVGSSYGFYEAIPFLILLVVNLIAFFFGKSIANRTLYIFAIVNVLLLVIGLIVGGTVAMWCLIGIGLFNSIMWSNIFTLAIAKLGKHTAQGSSLLVMMIVGGAILPLLSGVISDNLGITFFVFVPIVSYLYISFFGLYGYKPKTEEDLHLNDN